MVTGPHEVTPHPVWLGRRVTLICGPPGSGKSTLARQLHAEALELEGIVADDYRLRLKLYGRAAWRIGRARLPDVGVVRGAASQAERDHHAKLCRPARTIVLLTPADVCHQRVTERNRPDVGGEHEAIDTWWDVWHREHARPTTRDW